VQRVKSLWGIIEKMMEVLNVRSNPGNYFSTFEREANKRQDLSCKLSPDKWGHNGI